MLYPVAQPCYQQSGSSSSRNLTSFRVFSQLSQLVCHGWVERLAGGHAKLCCFVACSNGASIHEITRIIT